MESFLGFTNFGGELQAGVEAAFGFEVGMCLGGNSTYDLGFQPVVTRPDKYPFDFPAPLTISEGLLSGNGGRGIIKVTIVETPESGFIGSEQTDLDGNTVTRKNGNAGLAPYSYKVELERSFTD